MLMICYSQFTTITLFPCFSGEHLIHGNKKYNTYGHNDYLNTKNISKRIRYCSKKGEKGARVILSETNHQLTLNC